MILAALEVYANDITRKFKQIAKSKVPAEQKLEQIFETPFKANQDLKKQFGNLFKLLGSQAVLDFTKAIVNNRGQVEESKVQALREQGFSDKAIVEILGVIGIYTFLNYVKHMTQPVLDFPSVKEFS
jgi:alkylhydroperoxidase family enzyme